MTLDWHTLADYFRHFERTKSAINLGTFVGAGSIRNFVIGETNRPATPAELDQMRELVAQAMQDGAWGLSSALQYIPDQYASTDELVSLATVARQYGGVCFSPRPAFGRRPHLLIAGRSLRDLAASRHLGDRLASQDRLSRKLRQNA